jgi:tetratricopeptide (TPR) repeat protein
MLWIALVLSLALTACGPPGPRALLDGEKLIKQGRYAAAVERLRKATELLPKDARAWNYFGLALQGNQHPDEAIRAYQTALGLDHNLAAARYNLGCLHLEQSNLVAAAHELTSYALLQPANADGWLRLGSAYLRARSLAEAERCYKAALDVQPRHPEALNGLGVINFQRRLWKEAFNYFNLALTQNPNYGPALLNIAIVNQQGLNNRPAALRAYRSYLASQPHNAEWQTVDGLARQLDAELNPTALVLQPVTPVPPVPVRPSNTVQAAAKPPTNPPPIHAAVVVRTNPTPPIPRPPVVSTPVPTNPVIAVVHSPLDIPRPPTNIAVAPRPTEIVATAVHDDLVVKPAQDLGTRPTAITVPGSETPSSLLPSNLVGVTPESRAPSDSGKRSLISRLNPFSKKPKETDLQRAAPLKTNVIIASARPVALSPAPPPPPVLPRYPYQSPSVPSAGDRAKADVPFSRGLKAHQAGNRKLAIDEYQNALRADPSYYDAYYNLGLAAQDIGELGLALIAFEKALALKPDSIDARYNFALALKSGGYAQDAVDQLQQILQSHPQEVRAHLSMANICAQQLRQPDLAREHYAKVLELKPAHPEAGKIRVWLGNNPG